MFKHIQHGINLVKHYFRDISVSAKRSGQWPTVEKHFLGNHSACAACGSKKRLNVHHIRPFHVFPQLELDADNLITLCMDMKECHLRLGHCGNFKFFNKNIKRDAAEALEYPSRFEEIVKKATDHKIIN